MEERIGGPPGQPQEFHVSVLQRTSPSLHITRFEPRPHSENERQGRGRERSRCKKIGEIRSKRMARIPLLSS